ncbi:MAG: hypothetical protein M1827_006232 [Pycnora praestabilis]|nr:MAG: hypothetical protein M1827_006232 [Pycnora praestabilis]
MSTSEATGSRSGSEPGALVAKRAKGYSCVLCAQRKVKCDRRDPCSACIKSRVTCIFIDPAAPRRRKRKAPEVSLLARLKRYEELLKNYGVKIEGDEFEDHKVDHDHDRGEVEAASSSKSSGYARGDTRPVGKQLEESRSPGPDTGTMVLERGASRYVENHLYAGLSDEFRESKDIIQDSSDDEKTDVPLDVTSDATYTDGSALIFNSSFSELSLTSLHPKPVHVFRLWQTFLDNVNPLSKVIHAPTLQQQILDATGNPERVTKSMEALIFAIYSSAITSMSNEDCESMMGETKSTLRQRYNFGTQRALTRAGFLKSSDLRTLQAYTLFLISVRPYHDPRSLWILSGIAVRIGQRLGLHRNGASDGLSLFETELRCRLWWQIVMIDLRTSELSGAGNSSQVLLQDWDTRLPLNVNDSDISPDKRELPVEHTGTTEMIHCLLRYTFSHYMRHNWSNITDTITPLAERDRAINGLEIMLEDKFLKYCDRSIPLHLLAATGAHAGVCKMKLVAHHPRQYADRGAQLPQKEKDMLFALSLELIEYQNIANSSEDIKRFLWHVNVQFPYNAFIYLLSEICHHPVGNLADNAWRQITQVFEHRPDMITKTSNALSVAVGNLTLRAWKARLAAFARQHQSPPEGMNPEFIAILRSQRKDDSSISAGLKPAPSPTVDSRTSIRHTDSLATDPPHTQEQLLQVDNTGLSSQNFDPNTLAFQPFSTPPLPSFKQAIDPDNPADMMEWGSPMDWGYWDDLVKHSQLQAMSGVEDSDGTRIFD